MKAEFLNDEKDAVKIKFANEDATFVNVLKDELWLTKGVEVATVDKRHPLVGKPELTLHGKEPRKLLKSAVNSLRKKVDEFEKEILKQI